MDKPTIARRVSRSHVLSAYELGRGTFNWKTDFQRVPLDFDESRDLFVAILGDEVVGMLRLLPRPFRNGSRIVHSGLVDAVVVKQQYRGLGISRLLIEECQRVARAIGYESLHLFARRAVDEFYTKFGFLGASSYPRVHILGSLKSRRESRPAQTRHAVIADIEFLSDCHAFAYQDSAGPYVRDEHRWMAIINSDVQQIAILVLVVGRTRVGYVAVEQSEVVELGFKPDFSSANLEFVFDHGYSVLRIPPEHQLLRDLTQSSSLDVQVSYRLCHYGGHMICLLGQSNTFDDGAAGIHRLNEWLGAQSKVVGLQSGGRALSFSRLDEFIT